jgi:hypothetical protein
VTGYSNVVSATLSRDGKIVNESESYDESFRDQRFPHLIATGNGDWFRYRDVHFDGSPTQMVLRVGVPAQNEGQRVQVRLDSQTGPIIGDYQLRGSPGGWNEMIEQTIPISGASGVHDVYVIYSGPSGMTNSCLDWWLLKPSGVPCAPTRLSTRSMITQIQLNWYDNAGDETGYRVERAAPGEGFTALVTLPPNSQSYTDTTVTGNNRYRYRVIATNANGDSAATNVNSGRGGMLNPYQRIEAETADELSGAWFVDGAVGGMSNGRTIRYYSVDFGSEGASTFTAAIGVPSTDAGQFIDIFLDAPNGRWVGSLVVQPSVYVNLKSPNALARYNQGWSTYKVQSTSVFGATGVHDVYLVGRTNRWDAGVGHIDWIQFTANPVSPPAPLVPPDPTTPLELNPDQIDAISVR